MSNVIAQFHKGKYVNKPIQLGTTLAKDIILEDGDSVEAKFHRLVCNSNGELAFKGKNVVRSVNGVEADAEGNVKYDNVPDWSAGVTITSGYVCPSNGVVVADMSSTNSIGVIVNNVIVISIDGHGVVGNNREPIYITSNCSVAKNDVITALNWNNVGVITMKFYPLRTVTE